MKKIALALVAVTLLAGCTKGQTPDCPSGNCNITPHTTTIVVSTLPTTVTLTPATDAQ